MLYGLLALSLAPVAALVNEQTPLSDPTASDIGTKRIAVIGAGSGGSSSAYFLRKYADEALIPVNITVFERSSHIGGRSTTVNVFDEPSRPVELGASIFVKVNRNLVDAAQEFGLELEGAGSRAPAQAEDSLGVWDGESFVFKENANTSFWWDVAKLVWKYGLAPIKTQRLMKATVGKFLQLYEAPTFPWKSLSDVAYQVGLTEVTAATGTEFLAANGISEGFSRDIIQASTRVNYGQNLGLIHGLETMVCMAIEGAMAIQGGNWQIFSGMLSSSRADVHLSEEVVQLQRNDDGTTTVTSRHIKDTTTSDDDETPNTDTTSTFDEVIIAAPFQTLNLSILPPLPKSPDKIPYVKLHVTLFTSPHTLSPSYFNLPPGKSAPETILTTLPKSSSDEAASEASQAQTDGVGKAGFWSISTLRTEILPSRTRNNTYELNYLYKIFSPEPLNTTFISALLGFNDTDTSSSASSSSLTSLLQTCHLTWLHEKVWHSYPYLYPRVTFEDIKLDGGDGLWYTSGIESFISTMETSSLAGMNVGRLIVDEWIAKEHNGKMEMM